MQTLLAALVALWLAFGGVAPLAARVLNANEPMSCCKRQLKDCCCRKAKRTPGAKLNILTQCESGCATAAATASGAFEPPRNSVVIARTETHLHEIGFESSFAPAQFARVRFQRPPPVSLP